MHLTMLIELLWSREMRRWSEWKSPRCAEDDEEVSKRGDRVSENGGKERKLGKSGEAEERADGKRHTGMRGERISVSESRITTE